MKIQKALVLKVLSTSKTQIQLFSLALTIIFLIMYSPPAFSQNTEVESFHPNTTIRTEKEVSTYLPFHQKSALVNLEFVDGLAIMEGDIVLGDSFLYAGGVQFSVVIDGDSYRWKDGIIPYTIESGHPKTSLILQAIAHIESETNLRLVPRTTQNDYASFVTGDGCWSRVGRCGGKQRINIGNCGYGSIVHEILHTAGLWHEQSRSDRDNHITINWDNIESGKKNNFNKHVSDGIDIGGYDCNSIMHYPAFAFSKNGMPTITSTTCASIGQRKGMSQGDIFAINQLYNGTVPDDLTNKIWHLIAKVSGQAVDIRGGSVSPKSNVQQNKFNHSESQKFRFVNVGQDYYYIQNVKSSLVLTVQGGVLVSAANVWQETMKGIDAQKWRLLDAGEGFFYIRSKLGDLNLDVEGGLTDIGTNIRAAGNKGGPGQSFLLREATFAPPKEALYVTPLEHYWSPLKKDNFNAANSLSKNNAINGKYKFVRVDGYVLTKPSSVEGKATPLYSFYHDKFKDNFATASAEGIRVAKATGYRQVRIEGYVLKSVYPPYKNLYKPLWLYYNPNTKDNFLTASAQGMRAAEAGGYRKVRIEGYIRIDNSSRLATEIPTKVFKN